MAYTVKNIAPGPRGIHTPTGLKLLEPGEVRDDIDLSEGEYRNALTTGHFEISGGEASKAPGGRDEAIRETIAALGKDDFTSAGKPQVDAINTLLGDEFEHVTAAERDAVWDEMQA